MAETLKAVQAERDAHAATIAELQALAQAEDLRHKAELAEAHQAAYDARAALANMARGDGALHKLLRQLLDEGPPETEERRQAVMAWIRTHHEAEPLRRHIDLSERGRRLIVQEAEIEDWRDRHGKLAAMAERLAREKHEHAERANVAEERERTLRAELVQRDQRDLERAQASGTTPDPDQPGTPPTDRPGARVHGS